MDRSNHQADAQHLDGVICDQLQPDGHRHHPVYHHRARGYDAPDAEASQANARYERTSAPFAGNPGPLQERPVSDFPRDHEDVPGSRDQPRRLSGAAGSADAHPHRVVPGADTNPVRPTRRFGWTLPEAVLMDTTLPHLLGGPAGLGIPGHGLRGEPDLGHHSRCSGAGLFVHVDTAEIDHHPVHRPPAAVQPDDDAVDDAGDDRFLLDSIPCRPVDVLDSVQRHRHRHSSLGNAKGRASPAIPAVPQAGHRHGGACPICGR